MNKLTIPFFYIAIVQHVFKVPTDTEQNNLGFEVTSFERMLMDHKWNSSTFFKIELTRTSAFLQYSRFSDMILQHHKFMGIMQKLLLRFALEHEIATNSDAKIVEVRLPGTIIVFCI